MPSKILLLGGTQEARQLAETIGQHFPWQLTISLAGALGEAGASAFLKRLSPDLAQRVTLRMGGFGGVDGLVRFLRAEDIQLVVDATHPYAAQMSHNAALASAHCSLPHCRLARKAWERTPDDTWIGVPDLDGAAACLPSGSRAFLAVGRQSIVPFYGRQDCFFLVRSLAPVTLGPLSAHALCLQSMPSVNVEDEIALMKSHRIDYLVTKNSGASSAYAKVAAARALGIKVVMIDRPSVPDTPHFHTITSAIEWMKQQVN